MEAALAVPTVKGHKVNSFDALPDELREAVEQCIADGGIHLRPVLDLPHGEMGAAFFLEVLEAAAAAAAAWRVDDLSEGLPEMPTTRTKEALSSLKCHL